jgi:ribonuclease T2
VALINILHNIKQFLVIALLGLIRKMLIVVAIVIPTAGQAQLTSCAVPSVLPSAKAETPNVGERRQMPVTDYTLALSWSPQFCRTHEGEARHALQCGGPEPYAFIVHGLWPEGAGRDYPAWCRAADPLPRSLVRQNFCMMPSVNLQQHEWAKHGVCATRDAARYFGAAAKIFAGLRFPDMNALSRQPQNAGSLVNAIATLNPGLTGDMIKVQTSREGWLEEVRLCLNRDLKFFNCPKDAKGTEAGNRVKIWRTRK